MPASSDRSYQPFAARNPHMGAALGPGSLGGALGPGSLGGAPYEEQPRAVNPMSWGLQPVVSDHVIGGGASSANRDGGAPGSAISGIFGSSLLGQQGTDAAPSAGGLPQNGLLWSR